ncbi:MAG: hypothetical protein ABID63_10155 [Pseudomonadota bacterium]
MQDFQAAKWPFYLFVIMGILGLPGAGQGQAAEIRIGATIPIRPQTGILWQGLIN